MQSRREHKNKKWLLFAAGMAALFIIPSCTAKNTSSGNMASVVPEEAVQEDAFLAVEEDEAMLVQDSPSFTLDDFEPSSLELDKIGIIINGTKIDFDVDPFVSSARTFVQFRPIAEALEMTVEWNAETSTVVASNETSSVSFTIDSTNATVNGQPSVLDVAPIVVDGTAYVPLYLIAEAASMDMQWCSGISTIFVNDPNSYIMEYSSTGDLVYAGQVDSGGSRCGFGIQYAEDNSTMYIGQWLDGSQTGIGEFTWKSGTYYYGEFLNGQPDGYGIMVYPATGRYTGSYENGKRSGEGTFYWENGDSYCGIWEKDGYDGIGLYTFSDGTTLYGYWSDCIYLEDAVYAIQLDCGDCQLNLGEQVSLTAKVLPVTAEQKVVWSSSAPEIATVSESGLVTALSGGEAVITAQILEQDLKVQCYVNVKDEFKSIWDGAWTKYSSLATGSENSKIGTVTINAAEMCYYEGSDKSEIHKLTKDDEGNLTASYEDAFSNIVEVTFAVISDQKLLMEVIKTSYKEATGDVSTTKYYALKRE